MSATPKFNGGPAFPVTAPSASTGLSMRDYFAAKVLQGMASAPNFAPYDARGIAHLAYEIADAMLAERSKATGGEG